MERFHNLEDIKGVVRDNTAERVMEIVSDIGYLTFKYVG